MLAGGLLPLKPSPIRRCRLEALTVKTSINANELTKKKENAKLDPMRWKSAVLVRNENEAACTAPKPSQERELKGSDVVRIRYSCL